MKRAHKILAPRDEKGVQPPAVKESLLLTNASEIATMAGQDTPRRGEQMKDVGLILNGAIFCRNGRIIEIGDSAILTEKYSDARTVVDAEGKLVVPGFVDSHTHLVFAGSRENELEMKLRGATYQEISQAGGGISSTVSNTRAASLEDLVGQASPRLRRMLAEGTTTAEVKSGYGLNVDDEMKSLSAVEALSEMQPVRLVPTFLGAHAIPQEYGGRAETYVDMLVDDLLPQVARRTRARFCDVWVEQGYFTVDQARRLLYKAKEFGLTPKIHADELTYCGGAELAAEVGAASADHLIHLSDAGLRALAGSSCVGVLLPAASMSSHLPYADARRIISAGVPVALGTDLNPGCWVESMQFIVSLAVHQLRMTPAEAMTAATINAAHAIGLAREVGSVEVGKSADFLVLEADRLGQIGYKFGMNMVETVVKAGNVVSDRRPR